MRIAYATIFSLLSQLLLAQQQPSDTIVGSKSLQEVVVSGVKATANNPVTFTNLNKEEIQRKNYGQDLPFLLNLTPSTVVSSDAGAGIGYTGIRIRGTDAARTNVTINGVPINDAESHGMFWVNLPDFASSAQQIQVQRGVGTSSNGAGAFGASINIQTDGIQLKPYAEVSNSYGSFNTLKHTVKAGSGLLQNGWSFDARLSKVTSDGFIDRGASDLKSFFVSGSHATEKGLLKMMVFSGRERTYQAWYGVPQQRLNGDVQGMTELAGMLGFSQNELNHLLSSGNRTYNPYTYNNQTDNYQQDYYQLFYSRMLGKYMKAHVGLHYTYGRGYYEEFRNQESFTTYKLQDSLVLFDRFVNRANAAVADSATYQTVTRGDFVRRRWLDNDFYGAVFSVTYAREKLSATLGGGANQYDGRHYGELIWAQYALGSKLSDRFYEGTSAKTDVNVYLKTTYRFTDKLEAFIDIQQRQINYQLKGEDLNNGAYLPYDLNLEYSFFNPKAGLTYAISQNQNVYAYAGVANKEPIRNDIIQAGKNSIPKPERLINYELGYRRNWQKSAFSVNGYYMDYKDQLVATGEVNDVGAYNRVNVARSYRAGVELTAGVQLLKKLRWQATATYSRNKIASFTEYLDDWDNGVQIAINHRETDIAFSPTWIVSSMFTYIPFKQVEVDLISKYVGDQYLDNTQNDARKTDAFMVHDIRIGYQFKVKGWFEQVKVGVLVNNVLNTEYEPNGYTFSGFTGGRRYDFNYFYPQAGTNFLANLTLLF